MTATTQTLADFLLARVADDEAVARAASPSPWSFGDVASVGGGTLYDETRRIADVTYEQAEDHDGTVVRHLLSPEADANGAHIARHDPARVLAECVAKRAVVASVDLCMKRGTNGLSPSVLIALAQPYRDHPDFREEWAS